MQKFRVVCFEVGTVRKEAEERVCAEGEQQAAERVCGGPLVPSGNAGRLRAQVAPVSRPAERSWFYAPPRGAEPLG